MAEEVIDPPLKAAWSAGRRALGRDPVYGPWVRHIGTIRIPVWPDDDFFYRARAICYQQLAAAAAGTIHGRVVDALRGDVCPARVLETRESRLREAGLSRNKLAAIRDLAAKVRSGEVELHDIAEQPDEEVIDRLTRVRGIGEWTAHMFLMFKLRRPDVWPVGDLGVRAGFAKIHGLDAQPTAKELLPLGEAYRPWRSPAAFYCWRALETELT